MVKSWGFPTPVTQFYNLRKHINWDSIGNSEVRNNVLNFLSLIQILFLIHVWFDVYQVVLL